MNRRDLLTRALATTVAIPVGLRVLGNAELVWHTTDGQDIPLSLLEDDHLLNIERLLRGDGRRLPPKGWRAGYRVAVTREVARRGLTTKPALKREWEDYDISWDGDYVPGDEVWPS